MKSDGSNESTEMQKSKYNSAVSQLMRLDALQQSAHYNSRNGKLLLWNWDLDALWRELGAGVGKNYHAKYKNINKFLVEHKQNPSHVYQILQYKEMFLRELLDTLGKGSSYVDPDEDDLGE